MKKDNSLEEGKNIQTPVYVVKRGESNQPVFSYEDANFNAEFARRLFGTEVGKQFVHSITRRIEEPPPGRENKDLTVPNVNLLDLGGGTGIYGKYVKEIVCRSTGGSTSECPLQLLLADYSQDGLREAKAAGILRLVRANLFYPFPFADASIDFMLFKDVLPHFVFPQGRARLISEIARILKPGAILFLIWLPSFNTGLGRFAEVFGIRELLEEQSLMLIKEQSWQTSSIFDDWYTADKRGGAVEVWNRALMLIQKGKKEDQARRVSFYTRPSISNYGGVGVNF